MNHITRLLTIFGLLCVMGCATAPRTPFIAIGAPLNLTPRPPADVQIFFSPSQVQFPYSSIGNVYSQSTAEDFQSAKDQVIYIRNVAAANGADGVILSKKVLRKRGTYNSPENGVIHAAEIAIYSGTAIIKSTSAALAPLPVSISSEAVSISDLFAVPESYLNQTVVVEGIYSQLTVGQQATGFLLASPINSQLKLLCAYHNTELDESSRRLLMNKPLNGSLRLEGHLTNSSQGAAKDAGLSGSSGYELSVTRVIQ
jgi:hypothetical protein